MKRTTKKYSSAGAIAGLAVIGGITFGSFWLESEANESLSEALVQCHEHEDAINSKTCYENAVEANDVRGFTDNIQLMGFLAMSGLGVTVIIQSEQRLRESTTVEDGL